MKPVVKFIKEYETAKTPIYAHDTDSGMDLYSSETYILQPGECKLFETGIRIQLPEGYEAQIRPRSGLAAKHQVSVLNAPGTIDQSYTGPVKIILMNHSHTKQHVVNCGDRIAQMVIAPYKQAQLIEVDKLGETERGESGFGSTGQ